MLNLYLLLMAIVTVILILYTIFGKPPHYPMYIVFILFIVIPFSIPMLWSIVYKVTVDGRQITIRRGIGVKYSFDVSEISHIKWTITESNYYMPQTEALRIKTKSRNKFSIDSIMDGFSKMSEYIKENVDESKIETRIRKRKQKAEK